MDPVVHASGMTYFEDCYQIFFVVPALNLQQARFGLFRLGKVCFGYVRLGSLGCVRLG